MKKMEGEARAENRPGPGVNARSSITALGARKSNRLRRYFCRLSSLGPHKRGLISRNCSSLCLEAASDVGNAEKSPLQGHFFQSTKVSLGIFAELYVVEAEQTGMDGA
jgi:hypothetical protein